MIHRAVVANLKAASKLRGVIATATVTANTTAPALYNQFQRASISTNDYASSLANDVPLHSNSDIKIVLTGFSQLANRRDLDAYLGGIVADVDPILDERLLPTGKYLITLPRTHDTITWLNDIQAPKFSYQSVEERTIKRMKFSGLSFASSRNITNSTVRMINVAASVNEERLRVFLQDYELDSSRPAISRFDSQYQRKDQASLQLRKFIVHFSCPEEAQRAVVELSDTFYDTIQVKLFWYQC